MVGYVWSLGNTWALQVVPEFLKGVTNSLQVLVQSRYTCSTYGTTQNEPREDLHPGRYGGIPPLESPGALPALANGSGLTNATLIN